MRNEYCVPDVAVKMLTSGFALINAVCNTLKLERPGHDTLPYILASVVIS
jgi:hypothetical protein